MKKIFIVALLLVSTCLTALSITRDHPSVEAPLKKATIMEQAEAITTASALATAD